MLYFIINPHCHSGAGYVTWSKVQRRLSHKRIPFEAYLADSYEQAKDYASELTSRFDEDDHEALSFNGYERSNIENTLVVIGGDGTMNAVLNGLHIHTRFLLSFIPCGTVNDFALGLGLKTGTDVSLKRTLSPRMQGFVDYGVVSTGEDRTTRQRFLVSCGVGFTAALALRHGENSIVPFVDMLKNSGIGCAGKTISEAIHFRPTSGYIDLDGERRLHFKSIASISIQIQRYENDGYNMTPRADFSDGLFDICIITKKNMANMVPTMTAARHGRHVGMRGVHHYRARDIVVHLDTPMPVHVDGENMMFQTDLVLSCNQRQLRVLL